MTPPTVAVTLPLPPGIVASHHGADRARAEREWNNHIAWHCMAENATLRVAGPYALRLAVRQMPAAPHMLIRAAVIGLRRAGVLPGDQRARVLTVATDAAVETGSMLAQVWMLAPVEPAP